MRRCSERSGARGPDLIIGSETLIDGTHATKQPENGVALALKIMGWIVVAGGVFLGLRALSAFQAYRDLSIEGILWIGAAGQALASGLLLLAVAYLPEACQRTAQNTGDLLAYIKNEDAVKGTPEQTPRGPHPLEAFPAYDARRDPPVSMVWSYRCRPAKTLIDGSVAVETEVGWRRLQSVEVLEQSMKKLEVGNQK